MYVCIYYTRSLYIIYAYYSYTYTQYFLHICIYTHVFGINHNCRYSLGRYDQKHPRHLAPCFLPSWSDADAGPALF